MYIVDACIKAAGQCSVTRGEIQAVRPKYAHMNYTQNIVIRANRSANPGSCMVSKPRLRCARGVPDGEAQEEIPPFVMRRIRQGKPAAKTIGLM